MHDFDHILNWTLKQGSHAFPGPSGGTCINEAAIVAAGYPYRQVRHVSDMPACFSRPICELAMHLNDSASDSERQRLMPYVTRLACADEPKVERARERFIREHNRRRMSFDQGLATLDGALAIGRQAGALDDGEVRERLDGVREASARRALPIAREGFLAKITAWPWSKKATENV